MQLELSLINKLLKDLDYVDEKVATKVKKEIISETEGEGSSTIYNILYVMKEYPNIYVKVRYETDSYGSHDAIVGVEFVQPVERTVIVYEPI